MDEIRGKTGAEFAAKVISMVEELNLPTEGIRFQCYDTTSSMSGIYNGAQVNLSNLLGRVIPYIKCMGHKANLCVEHASDASVMIKKFFVTLQELYNFLTLSTSRFAKFKDEIEKLKDGLVMKNLSVTRWIGRAQSIIYVTLSAI